jgi:hypothetical protein
MTGAKNKMSQTCTGSVFNIRAEVFGTYEMLIQAFLIVINNSTL